MPKTVYTRSQIIKRVAKSVRIRSSLVKKIYDGIEDEIMELLASAKKDDGVVLRLFEGISVESEFLPHKDKVNNLTGEMITTSEKVRAKAHVTRNYCDKLTRYWDYE